MPVARTSCSLAARRPAGRRSRGRRRGARDGQATAACARARTASCRDDRPRARRARRTARGRWPRARRSAAPWSASSSGCAARARSTEATYAARRATPTTTSGARSSGSPARARSSCGAVARHARGHRGARQLTRHAARAAVADARAQPRVVDGGPAARRPGARVEFEGSELVWQYYPGQGLQLQVLGNFGKLNALVDRAPERPRWRFMLDELLPLAAERAGGLAWEYYFTLRRRPRRRGSAGSRRAPRCRRSRARRTRLEPPGRGAADRAARRSPLFEAPPPTGVRVPAEHGDHYAQYSFAPDLRVLNGFVQSLVGLHDYARLVRRPARHGAVRGGRAAARAHEVPTYDTGAWSLYSRGSVTRESDLSYHDLLQDFLDGLCNRTSEPVYCDDRASTSRLPDAAAGGRGASRARLRGGKAGPRALRAVEDLERHAADHARRPAGARRARRRRRPRHADLRLGRPAPRAATTRSS